MKNKLIYIYILAIFSIGAVFYFGRDKDKFTPAQKIEESKIADVVQPAVSDNQVLNSAGEVRGFATSASYSDFIPLNEGNWWQYKVSSVNVRDKEGNLKAKKDGSYEIFKNTDLVKIEVLKVARYKNITVALFNGMPGGSFEGKKALLVMDQKDYRWTSEDVFDLVVEKNGNVAIEEFEGKVRWNEFSLPFIKDTLFNCDEEDKKRGDNRYCDWVRSIKPANQKYFPGKIEYEIAQYTLSDESHSYYIEGVGLTRYSYSHHGPPDDVQWNLQKYFISTK